MEENDYWIWIARLKNVKHKILLELLKEFNAPEKIYNMTETQLLEKGLKKTEIEEILKQEYRENIKSYKEYMTNNSIEIITINSEEYPEKLKRIYDPPIVLFIKGNKNILKNKAIAIVRLQNSQHIWKANCRKNGI